MAIQLQLMFHNIKFKLMYYVFASTSKSLASKHCKIVKSNLPMSISNYNEQSWLFHQFVVNTMKTGDHGIMIDVNILRMIERIG